MKRASVVLLALLLGACASARPRPTPPPAPPGTTAPPETPPKSEDPKVEDPKVEDPTSCPVDTPDATQFAFAGRPKKADQPEGEWFFWFTAKVKASLTPWPEMCRERFEDPRQHGTCAFFPEKHPRRADCERKHGLPVLFGAGQRADNPWSADGDFDTPVVACLKSSCGDPTQQASCSVCSSWVVGAPPQ